MKAQVKKASLARLTTRLDRTHTHLSFSVRWVDPFFKSFGVGFLRSDNMRYELKVDQPFSKKWRYTALVKYEQDNLLRIMNYKNVFLSINHTLSYKIKRGLMARVNYTPLVRTVKSEATSFKNTNSIFTGLLTYVPKTSHVRTEITALYNYYLVNTDSQQVHFQNFSYSQQLIVKTGIKTGLQVAWYKNNLQDTLNNNVLTCTFHGQAGFKL